MNIRKFEIIAISIGNINGAFDSPESKAFKLANPLLLKTYRPEKKCDSENCRIFSSLGGGLKAGIADMMAKCNGTNHRLSMENTLRDLFKLYGFSNEAVLRKLILFVQRALEDNNITLNTKVQWLFEEPIVEPVVEEVK